MEIADRTKERSTVILAVLTLCVIGLTLILFTLQTFRHQREAEEQHLLLTTRALLLSVESTMRRTPVRDGGPKLTPQAAEFFRALEQDGDVLFVGIINEEEGKVMTAPGQSRPDVTLPPGVLDDIRRDGEWTGRLSMNGRSVFIAGKQLKPLRGLHMSLRSQVAPPGFLMVGVDMEEHLSSYKRFRKSVLFQGLYILAVALLTWGLGFRYLSRREQASKAVALENFQAKLLDNLPDGLITLGEDGIVRSANPAALSILKRNAKDVIGSQIGNLPIPLPVHAAENRTPRPEGQWRHIAHEQSYFEVLTLPLDTDKENSRLLIIRDRTQLRKLEKSLADAEKLAAVGTLAAGVAHEVRNPLSALRGFAQYFVKKLAGRSPEEEYAKTMVREADRLNRVISDLLFLGRPKVITPGTVDLEALIRELSSLLRFDLENKGLTITNRLEARTVYADEDALKQALLNLLLNSMDALHGQQPCEQRTIQMPLLPGLSIRQAEPVSSAGETRSAIPVPEASSDGPDSDSGVPGYSATESRAEETSANRPTTGERGRTAGNASPPSASARLEPPVLPDPMPASPLRICSGSVEGGVWIEVQDNGCGMTAEQKARAFEAFFTAKERGTGLGLALVQRTMLDHGGAVLIASEPGRGCVVRLFFPNSPGMVQTKTDPNP